MEDIQILHQKMQIKNTSNNYKTKLKKSTSKKLLNFSVIWVYLATDSLLYVYVKVS